MRYLRKRKEREKRGFVYEEREPTVTIMILDSH